MTKKVLYTRCAIYFALLVSEFVTICCIANFVPVPFIFVLSALWILEFALKVLWIYDDERSCQVRDDRAFEIKSLEARLKSLADDNQEITTRFQKLKALAIEYHTSGGQLKQEDLEQYNQLIGLEETTGFENPAHQSAKDSKEFLN